jgi:hypothetical protein
VSWNKGKRIIAPLFLLVTAGIMSGCQPVELDRGKPIARVDETYLFFDDIANRIPPGLEPEDSIVVVQNLIQAWGKEQLLLAKAKFNLSDKQLEIEKMVQEYRNDLLKFTYQEAYVNQNLDTLIDEAAIQAYYQENGHNFELRDNILKVSYFSVPPNAPTIAEMRKKFRSDKPEDWAEVRMFASTFATLASLDDTTWISFDEVLRIIPLEVFNQVDFLRRNKHVIFDFDGQVYFLKIEDYKIRESVSPLEYVQETIRNILLNQRKMELIQRMEKKIIEDAYEKKVFEIF